MSTIKYLLDENVDPDLRTALKAKWPEMVVWHVGDPSTPPDQRPIRLFSSGAKSAVSYWSPTIAAPCPFI